MTTEEWRPIPDWDDYEASTEGRIRSTKKGKTRVLRGVLVGGYPCYSLCQNGAKRRFAGHRLVLFTFVGPCPEGMEARHLDGNPENARLTNLAWGTHAENNRDRVRHGTHQEAAKTHCDSGHPFSPENTYHRRDYPGRQCRTCSRERRRNRKPKVIKELAS